MAGGGSRDPQSDAREQVPGGVSAGAAGLFVLGRRALT
jgi:hypothetical protein